MALQSSQRLPELLFYTKKSYRILQLQFQLQSYKSIHIQPTRAHYTPENSPSRIQFYMQKTKSSSSTTTFQREKRPSFQQLQVILHTELILLQEILQLQGSSHAGSFQQLFPVSPSILHSRIRLPAPLQHSRATQHKQASSNSTQQKQHSTRQPASTLSLQQLPGAFLQNSTRRNTTPKG